MEKVFGRRRGLGSDEAGMIDDEDSFERVRRERRYENERGVGQTRPDRGRVCL